MKDQTEFEPDLLLTPDHPLARCSRVYLDGQKLERCYEARVHWDSFVEPTFGEVIIGASRGDKKDLHTVMWKPRLGEFEYSNVWARFACGKVFIELDETGKKLLETLVLPYKGL